jgi:hypothetical protein
MRIRTLLILLVASTAVSGQVTLAKGGPSTFVDRGVVQHSRCDYAQPPHCTEGAKLIFASTSGVASFTMDFVTRKDGLHPPNPPTWIDMIVKFDSPTVDRTMPPRLGLLIDRRAYPLATRTDNRGVLIAPLPFADFVRITNATTVKMRGFDSEVTLAARQQTLLRFIAAHWAAGESMSTKTEGR